MAQMFNIGKIVNTHGVKGEVKIYPYTDDVTKFEKYSSLIVGERRIEVVSVRIHKNMALVKFKGYESIDSVHELINQSVYIPREMADDDGEGHYIVDLIGCIILDEYGKELGVLKDVLQNTAQDLYEIKRKDSKQVFYVPVVDEFVKSIDINARKIVIHLIEGMLE